MKLYTLKRLSEVKSISVFTLRKFVKQGMPHYLNGRKILVDPEEFDSWFITNFRRVDDGSECMNDINSIVNNVLSTMN